MLATNLSVDQHWTYARNKSKCGSTNLSLDLCSQQNQNILSCSYVRINLHLFQQQVTKFDPIFARICTYTRTNNAIIRITNPKSYARKKLIKMDLWGSLCLYQFAFMLAATLRQKNSSINNLNVQSNRKNAVWHNSSK